MQACAISKVLLLPHALSSIIDASAIIRSYYAHALVSIIVGKSRRSMHGFRTNERPPRNALEEAPLKSLHLRLQESPYIHPHCHQLPVKLCLTTTQTTTTICPTTLLTLTQHLPIYPLKNPDPSRHFTQAILNTLISSPNPTCLERCARSPRHKRIGHITTEVRFCPYIRFSECS